MSTMHLSDLSGELAGVIEKVGGSVVAVRGEGRGSSSGIHWRSGQIIASCRAIRGDQDLSITPHHGDPIPAKLVGRDPGTDVALLTIEGASKIPVASTTSTSNLKVGHVVFAIGRSHLGDLAASAGIVARLGAKWRTWRGGDIDQLIRPDVNLYPGQSGSALVNAQGQVLGMNTTALARAAAITVPAATIGRVVEELLTHGHIRRPYLGLAMQMVAVPENIQSKLNLDSATGLLVVHAEPDSPASTAGVMLGDVLIALEGNAIGDLSTLHDALSKLKTGEQATLAVVRGGERREMRAIVGDRPQRRSA